jgi:hypothetical protein
MNQSSNGMVNTMNQQSAQQAQQAGALFGAAGSIAGQYLGGLKKSTVEPVEPTAPPAYLTPSYAQGSMPAYQTPQQTSLNNLYSTIKY